MGFTCKFVGWLECIEGNDSVSVVGTALNRGPLLTFDELFVFFLRCRRVIAIVTAINTKQVGTPIVRGNDELEVSEVISDNAGFGLTCK